jgi:AcrR family transcriptional regulator
MAAAAHLFQERGYHNVSMEDVAAAVSLTGPALYRHFRNKHDILTQALTEQLSALQAVATRALDADIDPESRLEMFLRELTDLVLEREEALLWKRERRHLTGAEQLEFRRTLRTVLGLAVEILRKARPAMAAADADLLGWAVLSVYSSTRDYRAKLDPARTRALLGRMAGAILACDLSVAETGDRAEPLGRQPAGRRERILRSAALLFDEHGYYAVGIEDIAAASDTALATFYQNFPGKAELLQAVLQRGAEGLHYVTAHRLASAGTPEEALDTLIRTYIELARGPHRPLLGILTADLIYLPAEAQQAIRRSEREYVDEWVLAVGGVRPELPRAEARALAQSAIGMINDITQTAGMRARPRIADELRMLAKAVVNS